jgi:hypothetical protein
MLSPMQRMATTAVLIALAISVPLVAQRLAGQSFLPALAGEPAALASAPAADPVRADQAPARVADVAPADLALPISGAQAADLPAATSPALPAESATVAGAEPVGVSAVQPPRPVPTTAPTAAPAAVRTPAPTVAPVPTAAPTVAPVATATPTTCPATWFCYPRVGIAGPIVPYSDCSGGTDIGTSIRSFTCLSPFYLMGHAYTQFGQITQWRAGDVVSAWGREFTITGAFTQSSCQAPAQAIAPLSLQTSLTSAGCGSVLVVQGR